jgi:hypothetical protein
MALALGLPAFGKLKFHFWCEENLITETVPLVHLKEYFQKCGGIIVIASVFKSLLEMSHGHSND